MSVAAVIQSSSRRRDWRTLGGFWTKWSRHPPRPLPLRALSAVADGCPFAHPRCITPKRLQVIALTRILTHDMDDNVEKIQHYPAGLQCPIDRPRADGVLFAEFVTDLVHNSPQMRFTS